MVAMCVIIAFPAKHVILSLLRQPLKHVLIILAQMDSCITLQLKLVGLLVLQIARFVLMLLVVIFAMFKYFIIVLKFLFRMDMDINLVRNSVCPIQNFVHKRLIKGSFGVIPLNRVFNARAIAHPA